MKITKLFPLALSCVLPLAVVSCGEKEDEKKSDDTTGGPSEPKGETHASIAEKFSDTINQVMDGVISSKDVPSATAFGEKAGGYMDTLKDLLTAAKALPAPTDEEKAAVQKVKDASDKKAEEMMAALKALEDNPAGEAIGEIIGKVLSDDSMKATMTGMKELYNLKDRELPAGPGGEE